MTRQAPLRLTSEGWVSSRPAPSIPDTHEREVEDAFSIGLFLGFCSGAVAVTIFVLTVALLFT